MITQQQLKALADSVFARLNLGKPEEAGMKEAAKALVFGEILRITGQALLFLELEDYIEILRIVADGLDVVCQENRKDKL